jgi:hypothetical protein
MALCLPACATTECDKGSFHFELDSYNGSLGYSLTYDVNDHALTVTFRGDLEGERPKVLLTRSLSEKQRQTFVRGVEATICSTILAALVLVRCSVSEQR